MFRENSEEVAEGETLDLAMSLIDRKTAPFDAAAYHDRYAEALSQLIEDKRADRETPRAPTGRGGAREERGENVVDLMDALKKSLDAQEGCGGRSSGRKGGKAKASGGGSSGGRSKASGGSRASGSGASGAKSSGSRSSGTSGGSSGRSGGSGGRKKAS